MELTFPTDPFSQINMARSELSSSWLKLFELSVRQDGLKLSDFGETPESIEELRRQCNLADARSQINMARSELSSSWLKLFELSVRQDGLKLSDFGETPESIALLRKQCDVVEAHEALDEARAKRKSSWLSLFEQIVRNHGLKFEDFGETPESIEELRRQCSPE